MDGLYKRNLVSERLKEIQKEKNPLSDLFREEKLEHA